MVSNQSSWDQFKQAIFSSPAQPATDKKWASITKPMVDMGKSYLGQDGLQYIPKAMFEFLVAAATDWDKNGDGSVITANVQMISRTDKYGQIGLPRAKFEELVAKSSKRDQFMQEGK